MLKQLATAGAAALLLTSAMAPIADARTPHHSRYYYAHHHHRQHTQRCRTAGTMAGVAVGAVLGNAITHHSGVGTVVGAGVGGVAGHQIARDRCRR
jgi:uncharacterized protein YcfJ